MQVRFRTRQLERAFSSAHQAARAWGPTLGRRYVQRIEMLKAAESFEQLYEIRTLGLHPLRGNRRGQYAVRLTGPMRLILTRDAARDSITVEDVTDYHD